MSNNNNIYDISYTKQIILKTLLYKIYNKIYIIDIVYCKLYTSLPNSNFYFSGLEGALIFFYNIEEKNFFLILYDLNYYDILFKIKIESNLINKNILIPLNNNLLILELNGGFLGFLFPNEKEGENFINKIKENDRNYTENYIIENNKILKNKNNKENIIKILKQKFQRNLNDNNELDINNEQLNYNNNLEEILNCLDYNKEKNKFIFNGEKNLFEKFINENNIPLENIEFIENESFTIENKKHFINILINHFVNDIKNQKKLKDLYKKNKLKENNKIKKKPSNFMKKRHYSSNIPQTLKIENKLKEINNNEKNFSSKNIDFKRLSFKNLNSNSKIEKPKIDDIRYTMKSEMKIIKEINKDFKYNDDNIIPFEIENEEDEQINPFLFENQNLNRIYSRDDQLIKFSLSRKNNILANKNNEEKIVDKETNKLIKEISGINMEENNNNNEEKNGRIFNDKENINFNNNVIQNKNVINNKQKMCNNEIEINYNNDIKMNNLNNINIIENFIDNIKENQYQKEKINNNIENNNIYEEIKNNSLEKNNINEENSLEKNNIINEIKKNLLKIKKNYKNEENKNIISFEDINDKISFEKLKKINQILKNAETEKKIYFDSKFENNERKEIEYVLNKLKTLIYNKMNVSENKENANIDYCYLIKKK